MMTDRPVKGGTLLFSELGTPLGVVWSILGAIF